MSRCPHCHGVIPKEGSASTYCPACTSRVFVAVQRGIETGDLADIKGLACVSTALVGGARFTDLILRHEVASRLAAPARAKGGGAGKPASASSSSSSRSRSVSTSKGGKKAVPVRPAPPAPALSLKSAKVEAQAQLWYQDDRSKAAIEWGGVLEHFLFSNPLHVAGLVAAQGRGAGSASRAPALAQLLHTLTDTLGAAAVEQMLTGESAVDAYNQTPLDVASTVKGGAPAAVLALLEGGDSLRRALAKSKNLPAPKKAAPKKVAPTV